MSVVGGEKGLKTTIVTLVLSPQQAPTLYDHPQFVQRMLVLLMPTKYQPDYMFLRHVPIRRVHLFTFIQFLCLAGLCIIKEIKSISIIFPLMVRTLVLLVIGNS